MINVKLQSHGEDILRQEIHVSEERAHIRMRSAVGEQVDMDFTDIKSFTLTDTDVVFDTDFHPNKTGVLAVATIEGHIHV